MVKTECCMRKRSPILIIIHIPVALGKNILSSYLKILKLRMQYVPLYFPFILSYFSLSLTFSWWTKYKKDPPSELSLFTHEFLIIKNKINLQTFIYYTWIIDY